MPALVDTNILVYRFDPRFPDKQRIAHDLLRDGIASGDTGPRVRRSVPYFRSAELLPSS